MERASKIGVVIVDHHHSTRQLLARALVSESSCQVVGSTGTGEEALEICSRSKPRILILELFPTRPSAAQIIRALRKGQPRVAVILFTAVQDREEIAEALRERPQGFVRKQDSLDSLLTAMREVAAGRQYFSAMSEPAPDSSAYGGKDETLTQRERAVLCLVAQGLRTREIAEQLGISPKTAEHHRANLMGKLNLHNSASLTRYALRNGFIASEKLT